MMTITPEAILNEVDGLIEALEEDPNIGDADLVQALTLIGQRADVSVRSLTAPMTNDQRRAMFASFTNVFGRETKDARKTFTRLALCKPADAPVSWAVGGDRNGQGTLTQREASKVLDALTALEETL